MEWRNVAWQGRGAGRSNRSFATRDEMKAAAMITIAGSDPVLWAGIYLAADSQIFTGQLGVRAAAVEELADIWAAQGIPDGPEIFNQGYSLGQEQRGASNIYGTEFAVRLMNALIKRTDNVRDRGGMSLNLRWWWPD